jgi:uncharacterized protein HemX
MEFEALYYAVSFTGGKQVLCMSYSILVGAAINYFVNQRNAKKQEEEWKKKHQEELQSLRETYKKQETDINNQLTATKKELNSQREKLTKQIKDLKYSAHCFRFVSS